MGPMIVIGYHKDTGEAIDGTVLSDTECAVPIVNDAQAVGRALDWVAFEADEKVGDWRVFEYRPTWAPGREIKP